MDKFYIKIILAIISNTKKGAFILLNEDGGLPHCFLSEGHNFEDSLHEVLYKYSRLSPYWAHISPVSFQVKESVLECLFSTFIQEPTDIKVIGSKWVNCQELDDPIKNTVNKVIWTKRG